MICDIHMGEEASVRKLWVNIGKPIIHTINPKYIGFLILE
jgi:hypothetical protein